MAAVKSKGNISTERAVARLLRANKITGWRRHLAAIPGKPDFSFISAQLAVFVDGCFWHGCRTCRRNMQPSTNSDYWLKKIARNKARDRKVNTELRRKGWRVIRIWEHEVAKAPQTIIRRIQKRLLGGSMKKKAGVYNPEIELAKGATLDAASYDKTQKIKVTAGKVTVGGIPGRAEISGIATGHIPAAGIEGTCDIWLSIFRYMRPDGTIDHVGGWNIPIVLKPGQTAAATAKAFADYINAGTRPYRATAAGGKLKIVFTIK